MFHQHTERTTRKDQQNAKIAHYKKKIGPAGQKKDNLLLIPFIYNSYTASETSTRQRL